MGILVDYYRAANREAALERPDLGRANVKLLPGDPVFDGVDAKRIEPALMFAQLIAFINEVPWSVRDPSPMTLLYPPQHAKRPFEDDPYEHEPLILELDASVRDTLADVDDARLLDIARQWIGIEEFEGWTIEGEDMVPLIEELVGLARRAKQHDELLYCWISV
ncbi:hypothetical protein OIE66_39650 [Nonomuraea sp. NBC_01738]|uniref:hypothetical protein n=1 Tax=Nonomuraea sp. NBC_01738 TaxID=2976003 RepID=UPI002E12EF5B|nr:hypothetical protein OIE66_39650 [Nonomuraea sp. NBC_01738]